MGECTCAFLMDFEDGHGPQHRPGCPARVPPPRPKRWTPELIVDRMREFERREGRRLRMNDVAGQASPPGMPSGDAIRRAFGTFREACEVAYGEGIERGGRWAARNEDTERVIVALYSGKTLKELAEQRGISGQALGRRVVRYQRAHDLPVLRRKPGRPAGVASRTGAARSAG